MIRKFIAGIRIDASLSTVLARIPSRQKARIEEVIFNAETGRESIVKRSFRRQENGPDCCSTKGSGKINEMHAECGERRRETELLLGVVNSRSNLLIMFAFRSVG